MGVIANMQRAETTRGALVVILAINLSWAFEVSAESRVQTKSARSLLLESPLTRVDKVDAIPAGVLAALALLSPFNTEMGPGLANPEAPFQCCCDVTKGGPPRQRLVFAAGSPHLWALYFEHGGIGLHRHFVTFALDDDGRATPLESLDIREQLKAVDDIYRVARYAKTIREAGWRERW